MPGIDGPALCRELRGGPTPATTYVILLTGKETREDVISGLESGADDYIKKPVDWGEFRARLAIGVRTVELQQALAARVSELQDALVKVRSLSGLLPICAYCKRIRDDQQYWQKIETYFAEHSDAQFSHSICPECLDEHHPEFRR
jgi:sigma-B regulation protein RsbU (phosphoserine phosphatase)